MEGIEVRFNPKGNPHDRHSAVRHTTSISIGAQEELAALLNDDRGFQATHHCGRRTQHESRSRLLGRKIYTQDSRSLEYQLSSTEIRDRVTLSFIPEEGICEIEFTACPIYKPVRVPSLDDGEEWIDDPSKSLNVTNYATYVETKVQWVPEEPAACVACGLIHPYLYPEAVVFVTLAEQASIMAYRKRQLGMMT